MLEVNLACDFDDFSLQAHTQFPNTGISAVFGRSGSGKSTLLRCIAGFQTCNGTVRLGENFWLDTERGISIAPHKRPVGFVFQNARLFPHLDVSENLAFATRRAPDSKKITYADVIQTLGLEALMHRHTNDLSGGEKQRVALARTLLTQPELLLLDEPFSALDQQRKAELLPYIRETCEKYNIPTLLVSHAMVEVAQLAQYTVVLEQGRIQTAGPTQDILDNPELQQVSGRNESGSVLSARVVGYDERYQLAQLSCADQQLMVPTFHRPPADTSINLFVRARDVGIATSAPRNTSVRNILSGTIIAHRETPGTPFAELVIDIGGQLLHARITRAAVEDLGLCENRSVYALIKSVSFDQGEPP